ncbi:MAG: ATP-binding protein [Synergistaceae bacterium]|nr:ATP-binding protein [Synergistaceae bacterium]
MRELTIEANIENLNTVLDFVNEDLERHNCEPDLQREIDIAVEEVFVNIASYAYQPAKGNVTIFISTGKEVVVRFEDMGIPYNPLEQICPDLCKPITEREIGGLGVYFVKQMMDKVEYKHVDNKNILIVAKEIKKNK